MVTGAAGYIGSKLVGHLLDAGHSVIAVDNFRWGNKHSLNEHYDRYGFEFVLADVRDLSAYRGSAISADVIIPLAAIVGAPACDKNPVETVSVNQTAVKSLLKALSKSQRV